MTPQQDSLSGVIICPAYADGQRLRVNSFTVLTRLLHIQMHPSVKRSDEHIYKLCDDCFVLFIRDKAKLSWGKTNDITYPLRSLFL